MRRILVTGAVTMLAAVGTAVVMPAAEAATVQPNVSYVLVNRNSGKALDVYNLATNGSTSSNPPAPTRWAPTPSRRTSAATGHWTPAS